MIVKSASVTNTQNTIVENTYSSASATRYDLHFDDALLHALPALLIMLHFQSADSCLCKRYTYRPQVNSDGYSIKISNPHT